MKQVKRQIERRIERFLEFPRQPDEFEALFLDPVRRNAFFLAKLPALAFFGVDVRELTAERCQVRLPFTWRTQNPFQSVYFAAQAAAAELASGALVLRGLSGHPAISMLVTGLEGQFSKKARSDVFFTCEDGRVLLEGIERALAGEEAVVVVRSTGRLTDGTEVSRFTLTWSLKRKAPKA